MLRRLIVIGFILSTLCSGAFTVRSVANGNWEDPATWSNQQVPNSPDTIFVEHYVTFNQALSIGAPTILFVDSAGTLCGDYLLNLLCGSKLLNYGHMYVNTLQVRLGANYNRLEIRNLLSVQGCPPSGTGGFYAATGGHASSAWWPDSSRCGSRGTNWDPTGIHEFEKSGMKAFPNPVEDNLTVTSEDEIHISLSDVYGKELFSSNAFRSITIDLSGYAPGIYFLQAKQNGKTYRKKILRTD